MPPYSITLPVEVTPGQSFTIPLSSGSSEWAKLLPVHVSGLTVSLPVDQIHYSKRVPDELRYVYSGGQLHPVITPRKVRYDCVVLAVESPHLHEYTPAFQPIGPLQNPRTKTRINKYLPGLLNNAPTTVGITIPDDVDVVMVNPIQYQTSLVRLWQPAYRSKMLGRVRNTVWEGLWTASYNGFPIFQHDFLVRMGFCYRPFLTINACTAGLKHMVDSTLKAHGFQVVGVTEHPSYWNRSSRLVP